MKKAISLSIVIFMLVALLCACAGGTGESSAVSSAASSVPAESEAAESSTPAAEKATIRIAGLKGPTSIGMVSLMEKSENGETENKYEFTVAGAAD